MMGWEVMLGGVGDDWWEMKSVRRRPYCLVVAQVSMIFCRRHHFSHG